MEQAAGRNAFRCFTGFAVEAIFLCVEHVFIKCSLDVQVIFSVVRTKFFVVPLSFQTQDCSAEKYFRERVRIPEEGAETPSLAG